MFMFLNLLRINCDGRSRHHLLSLGMPKDSL
jgi:hypothetical protein